MTVDLDFIGRRVARMQTDQRYVRDDLAALRRELAELRDEIDAVAEELHDGIDAIQGGFAQLRALLEGRP